MALFTEGKLFKKAGEGSGGGGGGDQHNLGWYATQSALETAYPTATAGDWAIVGSTDTVWIWDTDTSAWKDSDQKGQVTSVNGQTGDVVLDLLPSQTGNSGKFLTTDGTDASWATINALQNTTTQSNSLAILGSTSGTLGNNICIGSMATTDSGQGQTVIGQGAQSYGSYNTIVGRASQSSGQYNVIVGSSIYSTDNNNIVISPKPVSMLCNHSIQLSTSDNSVSNSDSNTFKVANNNGNYEIMSADGTIPEARLADTTNATAGQVLTLDSNGNAIWANTATTPSTMPTLAVADWSNGSQTVNVTGVTATNIVFVSPAPASATDYASAGIVCTAQGNGTLSFTCTTTPTNAITVNVVCL